LLPSPDISALSSYARRLARRPQWHRPTPPSNGPAATLGQARCLTHVGRFRGTDSDEAQRLRRTAGGSAALSLRFATHACGPAGFARAVAFGRQPSGPHRAGLDARSIAYRRSAHGERLLLALFPHAAGARG